MKIASIAAMEGDRLLVQMDGAADLADGDQVLITGTGRAGIDGYHKVIAWSEDEQAFEVVGGLVGGKTIKGGNLDRISPQRELASILPDPKPPKAPGKHAKPHKE